jgi:hypothetical protein
VQVTHEVAPIRVSPIPVTECGTAADCEWQNCQVIENLFLGCPNGGTITAVPFGSFGLPIGSCTSSLHVNSSCDANTSKASIERLCLGKQSCIVPAFRATFGNIDPCNKQPNMRLAARVICSGTSPPPPNRSHFVDFGEEFTGGVRLRVQDGKAGQVVRFRSGELCMPLVFDPDAFGGLGQNVSSQCTSVGQTWGWSWNWTLRDGAQTIEQHQYMIFRYLSIDFLGVDETSRPPNNWSVSAWGVNAPFDGDQTFFDSSNTTLNRVWRLGAQMLEKGVLDTYTDSNARERRPYEADGLISSGNRMLLQRNNVMWARHSHSWIIQYPTWPVEWLLITPLLAYMDYWQTGSTDLADAYYELLFNNTQIHALNHSLGLIDTSAPGSRDKDLWNRTGSGRHLIGWAPAPIDSHDIWMWSPSSYMSVPNFYTVHGLECLAEMAVAAGRHADAQKCTRAATALRSNIEKHMWDAQAQRFCDGICTDVNSNHSIYTDMFSLWLGLVPPASRIFVWNATTAWGMEHLGDFGMYVYLKALAAYPGDTGHAAVNALTKCDEDSWCVL